MTRKRRRELPRLNGVQVKLDRAQGHEAELKRAFRQAFPMGVCATTVEVHADGCRHVHRAKDPPVLDPAWSAIIGDCLHNLRAALDHLAYQLVRVCGHEPTHSTSFPILTRPPRRWRRRQLPEISGGVSKDIRQALDSIQPYNRRHLHHGLDALRDLDNIDKHRAIVAVTVASAATSTLVDPDGPESPESETIWTGKPLKDGEVVGVIVYPEPQLQPDPHLRFMPHIQFGVGEPLARHHVLLALHQLRERVQETVEMFRPLF